MNSHVKQIYICRYNFFEDKCHWLLTESKEEAANFDPNFQVATIEDLREWTAASGQTFNGILAVNEGLCKWFELDWTDEYGDIEYEFDYKLL